ncbi:CLUMA_CG000230, isoform A [Clunio marinus]|uniref:CLUMA_CG000230, isoform A n=1 Tax=Clunio marinus TaxID=568069 RepID=A0A1J1HDV5_9DIPT|nr:CLUMA_CG000230, isoform A [Clunio marinus]
MDSNKFDLLFVAEKFKNSLNHEDDVLINFYLEAFREILKFFQLMGSIFGFVSSDVKSKIEILEAFQLNNEKNEHFQSVKKMITYEQDEDLLYKKDYVSGCRTLLRLHRGLDFVRNFLKKLETLSGSEKADKVCSQSYNETLANFHPFFIRKAAALAIYAIPTRDQLLQKVCSDVALAIQSLPEMLQVTDVVYNRINELYSCYNLHELP